MADIKFFKIEDDCTLGIDGGPITVKKLLQDLAERNHTMLPSSSTFPSWSFHIAPTRYPVEAR
jgi:hypothetical protein